MEININFSMNAKFDDYRNIDEKEKETFINKNFQSYHFLRTYNK